MIIQHNMSAMIAGNANNKNVTGLKKRTEKLSTGYKINRAADNASGLSVSEKMRSQIRGLSQATNNANDAISLMQTAEGGLQETENILQRMRELAVQSANGTYTDEDRAHLQDEVDALKGEIDRISDSTEFNEMKLLSGEVTVSLETKVPTNDYGARYGSINYSLDIGGGKISVASSIQGMWLKFTTGASGKGGENAYYEYDLDRTQGELTQHITINLAAGQHYTDEQIQKLIDNANYPKNFETAPGKVLFKSEAGQIQAAEAETYGLVTGDRKQEIKVTDSKNAGKLPKITADRVAATGTQKVSFQDTYTVKYVTTPTEKLVNVDKSSRTITISAAEEYATEADARNALISLGTSVYSTFNNFAAPIYYNTVSGEENGQKYVNHLGQPVRTNNLADVRVPSYDHASYERVDVYEKDEEGNDKLDENGEKILERSYYRLKDSSVTVEVDRLQCVAYVPRSSSYSFTLSAAQYGSYEEYVQDEEKYKYPDAVDEYNMKALKGIKIQGSSSATNDIEVNIGSDNYVTVSLKKDAVMTGADVKNAIQAKLDAEGFKYSVDMTEKRGTYVANSRSPSDLDNTVAVRDSGGYTSSFAGGTGSVTGTIPTPGHRSVRRVGTVAGVRQTAEADLASLLIQPGSGTIGSADYIKFTANSYGKAMNYEGTLVPEFRISTEQDLPAGGEYVDTSTGIAEIHLATGTKYTNESIEKLLKDVGLDYTVELTDTHDPDGDKDGGIIFNNTGSVRVYERIAGQGVGLEDAADITDKLEFQIGANGVEDQKAGMDIIDASAKAIGVADISVATQYDANKAIEKIDDAVKLVSTHRAKMGALQNRMEKSVNSLNTANENLTDAESRIRDTDVASEMVEYQKNNILQQASQSMLAQANQQPNGILSLLG